MKSFPHNPYKIFHFRDLWTVWKFLKFIFVRGRLSQHWFYFPLRPIHPVKLYIHACFKERDFVLTFENTALSLVGSVSRNFKQQKARGAANDWIANLPQSLYLTGSHEVTENPHNAKTARTRCFAIWNSDQRWLSQYRNICWMERYVDLQSHMTNFVFLVSVSLATHVTQPFSRSRFLGFKLNWHFMKFAFFFS